MRRHRGLYRKAGGVEAKRPVYVTFRLGAGSELG